MITDTIIGLCFQFSWYLQLQLIHNWWPPGKHLSNSIDEEPEPEPLVYITRTELEPNFSKYSEPESNTNRKFWGFPISSPNTWNSLSSSVPKRFGQYSLTWMAKFGIVTHERGSCLRVNNAPSQWAVASALKTFRNDYAHMVRATVTYFRMT